MSTIDMLFQLAATLPVMEFRFGQIPSFFETTEFFVLASQLISQILAAIVNGFLGAFVNGLFGVTV